ncbi:MAG: TerC family protein [Syntrophobacteraceae bacterium]|jgi:YjbE family integral membrane protein|nr:TerC family protein [Syntrophobacteraceae bacterium]
MALDLGAIGSISLDWAFLASLLDIVIIDLILAGDNAVVIAMAVRTLPREERLKGIVFGSAAAVILRVLVTFIVARLLLINFIKLAGGALILWLAVRLFVEGAPQGDIPKKPATLGQAIRIIVIADITMAVDNMLAVAGASEGNLFLLLVGLGLSIPFVVFSSNLICVLMDRYPIIITIGAAILGKVGGEMMITDPFVVQWLNPSPWVIVANQAFFAVVVIVAGKLWMRWLTCRKAAECFHAHAEPAVRTERAE